MKILAFLISSVYLASVAKAALLDEEIVRDPVSQRVVQVRSPDNFERRSSMKFPDLSGRWKVMIGKQEQPYQTFEVEVVNTPDCTLPTKAAAFVFSKGESDKVILRGIALSGEDWMAMSLKDQTGAAVDVDTKKVNDSVFEGTAKITDISGTVKTYSIGLSRQASQASLVSVLPVVVNLNSIPRKDPPRLLIRAPGSGSLLGDLTLNASNHSLLAGCYRDHIGEFNFNTYVYSDSNMFGMTYVDANDPGHQGSMGFMDGANPPAFQAEPLLLTMITKDGLSSLEIVKRAARSRQ